MIYVTKVRKSRECNTFYSINHLVDHMFCEIEKVFKGIVHKFNWIFYHDALSIFIAINTVGYMISKGYMTHLIIPLYGCNKGIDYANCMVEMFPDIMSPDVHQNQDLHKMTNRYINLNTYLRINHKHKYSKQTPNNPSKAYLCIWNHKFDPNTCAPVRK